MRTDRLNLSSFARFTNPFRSAYRNTAVGSPPASLTSAMIFSKTSRSGSGRGYGKACGSCRTTIANYTRLCSRYRVRTGRLRKKTMPRTARQVPCYRIGSVPVLLNLSTLSTLSTPKTYQYIKNFFYFLQFRVLYVLTVLTLYSTGLARLPVPLNLSTLSTLSTPKTYQYIKNFFLFSSISSVVCADSVDTLFFYLNHNALCPDFSDPDRFPQPIIAPSLHQPLPVGIS